jgi:hypothetical protein
MSYTAELASVFWSMAFMNFIQLNIFAPGIIGVSVWAGATFLILMVMESLSAFLHALRLQWYIHFLSLFISTTQHLEFVVGLSFRTNSIMVMANRLFLSRINEFSQAQMKYETFVK